MTDSANRQSSPALLACHECDLLLSRPVLAPGQILRCPRCDHVVLRYKRNAMQRTLACTLTALLLLLPGAALPLLTITIAGQTHATNVLNGVLMLHKGGYEWVAVSVAFTAVVAPALELLLLLVIALLAAWRVTGPVLARLLRIQNWLTHWGMLDVYLISVLVCVFKLGDMGDLVLGPGLACYTGLLLCATLALTSFDPDQIWERFNERAR